LLLMDSLLDMVCVWWLRWWELQWRVEGGGGRRAARAAGEAAKGIHDALAILRAESRVNALRRKCMRWCHSQAGKAG